MRDFGKGRIVGAKTAGKGTLQRMYTMTDGSAVSLTVAVMVPGKSESFDGVGVAPDYERVLSAEEELAYYDYTVNDDPQIQRAIEVAVSLAAGNSGNGPAPSVQRRAGLFLPGLLQRGGGGSSAPQDGSSAAQDGSAPAESSSSDSAA